LLGVFISIPFLVLAFLPGLIKNSYLYNIEKDEDTGEVFIKRYKIKNWKQIREEI
jgi:hypothetical protein